MRTCSFCLNIEAGKKQYHCQLEYVIMSADKLA